MQSTNRLHVLLESKKVFGKDAQKVFKPKRRLLLSVFSNLKFIDGKIIPEWKEPFDILLSDDSIKQKSYNSCRINVNEIVWLPLAELFRTKYRDDITHLGRLFETHRVIREMIQISDSERMISIPDFI